MSKDKGWAFPVAVSETGRLRTTSGHRLVEQSLRLILGTSKGERASRPDFGCDLGHLVFAPNNSDTLGRIVSTITDALTQWEPRVTVDNVEARPSSTDPARIDISIECTFDETGEKMDFEQMFYLKGD